MSEQTITVELTRDEAQALLDPDGAYREAMVLRRADDTLRAALDQPHHKGRVEVAAEEERMPESHRLLRPTGESHRLLRPTGERSWSPEDFPEEAVGIRLVRIVQPGDRLRLYEGIRWPSGRVGIAQFLRQTVLPVDAFASADYALADVLDADHNIIADFGIANAEAFRRIRGKLRCRVESTDGEPDTTEGGDRE